MAEDWDVYLGPVNDQPAAIFVDLAPATAPQDRQRPWLLRVSIELQVQRADGLNDPDETDVLYAIEDELFAAIARGLRARYVGRVTSQGRREHYYYGVSADGFREASAAAMEAFDNYSFACYDEQDSDWRTYHELLYPGPLELRTIQNRRVVQQLTERGDDLSEPRDVDHWMYFPSEEHRDQFLLQIAGNGFRTECHLAEEAEPELRYGVQLTRSDRVDLETIDGLVTDLFLRTQNCGGEYDGWGTSVIGNR
jgi:uncharacterized protein (TIGR01619 family)